jgi:hypothetical protein
MTIDRLAGRRSLLQQLDSERRRVDTAVPRTVYARHQERAFSLLTSAAVRSAFEVEREPASLRDTYGRTLFGSSTLVARRLIEAGVRFVNVTCVTLTSM